MASVSGVTTIGFHPTSASRSVDPPDADRLVADMAGALHAVAESISAEGATAEQGSRVTR